MLAVGELGVDKLGAEFMGIAMMVGLMTVVNGAGGGGDVGGP